MAGKKPLCRAGEENQRILRAAWTGSEETILSDGNEPVRITGTHLVNGKGGTSL